jgi:secreted protein with Ig-like and vWFA domain
MLQIIPRAEYIAQGIGKIVQAKGIIANDNSRHLALLYLSQSLDRWIGNRP